MKVRLFLLLSLIFLLTASPIIQARRLTVNLTFAGELAKAIQGQNDITELIISGSMNENDFLTITEDEHLPMQLTLIDISSVSLEVLPDRALSYCQALTTVILPTNLKSVGYSAFGNCLSLIHIVLPNTVVQIGTYSFSGCSSLTELNLPEGITQIPRRAFESTSSLAQINFPSTLKEIASGAFYSSGLSSVTLPEGLLYIKEDAFYQTQLESITLPASLRELGINALVNCRSLASISVAKENLQFASRDGVLFNANFTALLNYPPAKEGDHYEVPTTINTLGTFSFYGAYDENGEPYPSLLKTIKLPDGLTRIGEGAFSGCSSLKSLTLPESLKSIGIGAFFFAGLERIAIPQSITELKPQVFFNCKSLKEVILPQTLKKIEDYTFYHCEKLTSIHIPNSVEEIEAGAFSDCYALKEIILPERLTILNEGLFGNCTSLSEITLPDCITKISDTAFSNCTSLARVHFPTALQSLGEAFSFCTALTNIVLPASLINFDLYAFMECVNLQHIYLYAPIPPQTEDYDRIYLPEDIIIYVPEASVDAYKSHFSWGAFDIRPLSASGTSAAEVENEGLRISFSPEGNLQINIPMKGSVEIFSLNGTRLHQQSVEVGENRIEGVRNTNGLIVSYTRIEGGKRQSVLIPPSGH